MRVLTYNVQMLPIIARWKKKRMEALLKREFLEYDIIGLQEHFSIRSPFLRWMCPQHPTIGFSGAHSPHPLSITKLISGGLSIYTRYEIVSSCFYPFQCAVGMDKLAEKGVLYAKICHGSGLYLHVFNTHLQAGRSTRASLIRMDQLQDVQKFIFENTRSDRYPIMLLGDFNEHVNLDGFPKVRKYASISKTINSFKDRCLDYIIVQQDRMIMIGHDQKNNFDHFSDHSGISVSTFLN